MFDKMNPRRYTHTQAHTHKGPQTRKFAENRTPHTQIQTRLIRYKLGNNVEEGTSFTAPSRPPLFPPGRTPVPPPHTAAHALRRRHIKSAVGPRSGPSSRGGTEAGRVDIVVPRRTIGGRSPRSAVPEGGREGGKDSC